MSKLADCATYDIVAWCSVMDGSPEELLTSPQVGVELGVSARTVHRWLEAGELHSAHKLRGPNGAFLFRRSEIDAFKKRQANAAASA